MKENRFLYFLKGIGCIAVVFIHVPFPGTPGSVIKQLCAFAVPVFLMSSGYFAVGIREDQALRRLKKTAQMLLYGLAASLLVTLVREIRRGSAEAWLAAHLSWRTLGKALIFCTVDFAVPLWYLIAMCEVWALWLLVIRKGKQRAALSLIPVLNAARIFLSVYCKTRRVDWFWEINFLTTALPWFLIGYWIRENEDRVRGWGDGSLWAAMAGGALLSLIPVLFHTRIRFSVLGDVPYAVSLFILAVKHPDRRISGWAEGIGKHLSAGVYLLHGPADAVVLWMASRAVGTEGIYARIHPLLVALCALAAAGMIRIIFPRKR
ncbi:MAG: acyltransferase [Clostridia bacterium]|nr:acyltransferase [Clostridia bacterium]